MEHEMPDEAQVPSELSGGRRNPTQSSVLPRSGMPSRGDREIDHHSSSYATPSGSSNTHPRSQYYEKSLHAASKRGATKRRRKTDEDIIKETMRNKDRLLLYLDRTNWVFQGEYFDHSVDLSLHFKE
ncbi:unnamed protein product [Moneuplotes crassus]|uniref:Uncharacterized protein n=1 Tax=Euplotes crassus TaxID=5936 RepID=A0AAD2D5H4_EUPCR|nr:unnamed protein product [Moneuplotes crassus]